MTWSPAYLKQEYFVDDTDNKVCWCSWSWCIQIALALPSAVRSRLSQLCAPSRLQTCQHLFAFINDLDAYHMLLF
jgi:hypothetical protein